MIVKANDLVLVSLQQKLTKPDEKGVCKPYAIGTFGGADLDSSNEEFYIPAELDLKGLKRFQPVNVEFEMYSAFDKKAGMKVNRVNVKSIVPAVVLK